MHARDFDCGSYCLDLARAFYVTALPQLSPKGAEICYSQSYPHGCGDYEKDLRNCGLAGLLKNNLNYGHRRSTGLMANRHAKCVGH
jgi:hypothetical protein